MHHHDACTAWQAVLTASQLGTSQSKVCLHTALRPLVSGQLAA